MLPLIISQSLYHKIEAEGSDIFPNECCGIIYGHDHADRRVVSRLEAVSNEFEDSEKYHRFSITPKDLIAAEKSAAAHGELVLGFYHSHPNAPARPSEYDRVHAWPFYSYIIVSIMDRKAADMTCWLLNEQTEQFEKQEMIYE